MITKGRLVVATILAFGVGFVGGIWFIGSGVGFQLITLPTVEPASGVVAGMAPRPPAPPPPKVKAVAVPKTGQGGGGGSAGLGQRAARADLMPGLGCEWVIDPRPFDPNRGWIFHTPERWIAGYLASDTTTGGLRFFLVQSTVPGVADLKLRPVFFDELANRYVPLSHGESSSRGRNGSFLAGTFHIDPSDQFASQAMAYIGVERVASNEQELIAKAAQQEAKAKGFPILPYPNLGQPYSFDMTTFDKKHVRTEDFRGKVLVVAVWGPGGFGSGASVIKRAREAGKKDDLALVNVSYDGSVEDALRSTAQTGLDSPLVVIPNDPAIRSSWSKGSKINELPKFFLIDREGILRNECSLLNLSDSIDILLGRAKRWDMPKPALPARSTTIPQSVR